jgi:hypothetical protein
MRSPYDIQSKFFAGEVLRVLLAEEDVRALVVDQHNAVLTSGSNGSVLLTEDGDIGALVKAIQRDLGSSPLSQTFHLPPINTF